MSAKSSSLDVSGTLMVVRDDDTSTTATAATSSVGYYSQDPEPIPELPFGSLLVAKPVVRPVDDIVEIIKRRLLIDGDGQDDKKLTRLAETYIKFLDDDRWEQSEQAIDAYSNTVKSLFLQVDGIRVNGIRAYEAIVANIAASGTYESLKESIRKELLEMKVIVEVKRQAVADLKRNKKQCQEREALMKLLEGTTERARSEKEIERLQKECKELQAFHNELDEKINGKQVYLGYLSDLLERLCSETDVVEEDAWRKIMDKDLDSDTEEKAMSDISMELE